MNTDISLYTGDTGALEITINLGTVAVHNRLNDLGIVHRFTIYPGFSHNWATFGKAFVDWLPRVMDRFAHPADNPQAFTFASIQSTYSQYDWTVQTQRDVVEFGALEVIDRRHFNVVGSGSATVQTPPIWVPGAAYRVITKSSGRSSEQLANADGDGRLIVPVTLRSRNATQQFSPGADTASTGQSTDAVPFTVRGNSSRFSRTQVVIKGGGGGGMDVTILLGLGLLLLARREQTKTLRK